MSAENPIPNPELFGQERVRKEINTELIRARDYYQSPLVTQAALTINLALAEPPMQHAQNIDATGIDFSYKTQGVIVARSYLYNGKLSNHASVTFPPEAFGRETASGRYLTVTFHKSVPLSNEGMEKPKSRIFAVDLFGIEKVKIPHKPDISRIIAGPVKEHTTQIDRSQNGIGINPDRPAEHANTMETIFILTDTLPPFGPKFFDAIFAVVPPTK